MADDAAPIVFALSCLTAILVPWTLLKLRRLARKSVAEADAWLALGFAPTSAVVAKARTSCLLYTSPSPRDKRQSRMPSSA